MADATDILVAGPGAAGMSAALALARAGYRVTLAGPGNLAESPRTLALFEGTLRFLDAIDMRAPVTGAGWPIVAMRIADDTSSPFKRGANLFHASDIGLGQLGFNIENHVLARLLLDAVSAEPAILQRPEPVARYRFEDRQVVATLAGGQDIVARLVVAADGAASPARRAARIPALRWDYPQTALTATLGHTFDHENISTELHTREGPFTLVPLGPDADGAARSALVWLMSRDKARRRLALAPDDLIEEIELAAHYLLGPMTLLRPASAYPIRGLSARRLAAHRIALVGEAAHVFPPIGAQGLNLGLRDVAHLVEVLTEGDPMSPERRWDDPGAADVTEDYAALRAGDVASRSMAVDFLNRALLDHSASMDFLRGAGMALLDISGPLRRALMREGLVPALGAPAVMRQPGLREPA